MPAYGFTRIHGRCNFSKHLQIAVNDTWKIHHLTKTDNTGPCHCLDHVGGGNLKPSGFQTRCGRRARWHLGVDVDRLHQRLVMHHAHAVHAKHVRNLVRVSEHRGGSMWNNSSGKFGRSQHTGLNMHMAVAQTRDHIATVHLNHLCVWANAMGRINANICKTPMSDSNLPTV